MRTPPRSDGGSGQMYRNRPPFPNSPNHVLCRRVANLGVAEFLPQMNVVEEGEIPGDNNPESGVQDGEQQVYPRFPKHDRDTSSALEQSTKKMQALIQEMNNALYDVKATAIADTNERVRQLLHRVSKLEAAMAPLQLQVQGLEFTVDNLQQDNRDLQQRLDNYDLKMRQALMKIIRELLGAAVDKGRAAVVTLLNHFNTIENERYEASLARGEEVEIKSAPEHVEQVLSEQLNDVLAHLATCVEPRGESLKDFAIPAKIVDKIIAEVRGVTSMLFVNEAISSSVKDLVRLLPNDFTGRALAEVAEAAFTCIEPEEDDEGVANASASE